MTAVVSSAAAKLDRDRAIVLVIDLQGRLVDLMDRSRMLLDGTARLLRLAQLFDLPVIVTEQYPRGLGPTREEVEKAIAETDPDGSRTRRVEKDSFGCCGVPAFEDALDAARPGLPASERQVVVAGIEAHICVVQTVLDLLGAARTSMSAGIASARAAGSTGATRWIGWGTRAPRSRTTSRWPSSLPGTRTIRGSRA